MIISDKQYSEIQILTEDDELIADIADENYVVKSGYKIVFVPTERKPKKVHNKKTSAVQSATSIVPREPPRQGYDESKFVLSDCMVIRFSVPVRVWNELRKTKEWKDFQSLLEKVQREHIQK